METTSQLSQRIILQHYTGVQDTNATIPRLLSARLHVAGSSTMDCLYVAIASSPSVTQPAKQLISAISRCFCCRCWMLAHLSAEHGCDTHDMP